MSAKRIFTAEQVSFIATCRGNGQLWEYVTAVFNRRFKTKHSAEALRHALRAHGTVAKRTKPTVTPERMRAVMRADAKVPSEADKDNTRVLLISDMHCPFQHPDTVAFLAALKKRYRPTRVICLGDEIDQHNLSFHDTDPDLPGAGDELKLAIQELRPIYEMFPVVDLIDSNHGSMVYRKGKHHGIPRKYLRGYGEVLEAPKGWVWQHDLTITIPGGNQVFITHGLSNDVMKIVQQRGMCVIQGHYHSIFRIGYSGNPAALLWGMQSGCLIDGKSYAFAYDKTNIARPIIGTTLILDGLPHLAPMILKKDGRWNGVVP